MESFHPQKILKSLFICLSFFFNPYLTAAEIPVIAAAANIRLALSEIADVFHKDTGKSLRISYSSSGNLTRQIQQGGPFELFLSADVESVKRLNQQHKTEGQGTIYATGRLVLLTAKDLDLQIGDQLSGLKQALEKGQLQRFAIANPELAPYGAAARDVLQNKGLWELIQPHLVLGENVAQTAQFISSGAAQAGLIAYSLALSPVLQNSTHSILIPSSLHQPLQQSMALLKNAGETAILFYHYLQQDKARAILSRHGYTTPQG